MEVRRFTGSAEAYHTHYLKKSVLNYLNGQYDWKWIMAILRQSGMGKPEVRSILMPLKGKGWRFRSQALFAWLEQP